MKAAYSGEDRARIFRFKGMVIPLLLILVITAAPASGVSVAKITVDEREKTVKQGEDVYVRGSVSTARGQVIVLLAEDGESLLNQTAAGTGGKSERFRLKVPVRALKGGGDIAVFVRSCPVKGLAASKKVRVLIHGEKKEQTISGPEKIVLTNLKKTRKIGAKAESGEELTYQSNKPSVVSVNTSGKLSRKKNGRVKITISQKGNEKYRPAEKTVIVISRKSNRKEQIDAAVSWAVKIAKNNKFTYGTGSGAHHNGCYFCGTNFGPRKYMKPGKRYRRTYCCNPFIHAAYAHGAKNPRMLTGCRRASGIGMQKSTFYKFGCWKCVGRPAYKKLQKGDVLVNYCHVAMYIGKKRLVEASGGTWSASSIAVRHMSRSRYRGFSFVMRYTGY